MLLATHYGTMLDNYLSVQYCTTIMVEDLSNTHTIILLLPYPLGMFTDHKNIKLELVMFVILKHGIP